MTEDDIGCHRFAIAGMAATTAARGWGKAIADHIPPNVLAYGHGYRTRLHAEHPLGSPGPKTKKAVAQALKLMGEGKEQ